MTKTVLILSSALLVAGCNTLQLNSSILGGSAPASDPAVATSEQDPGAPLSAIPGNDVPVSEVGTGLDGEVFQGSTEGKPAFSGQAQTIASLGDPTVPGLWMETPLVSSRRNARLTAPNGKSIVVTLEPISGAAGQGSRLSIDGMRALGLPLTELVELKVGPA